MATERKYISLRRLEEALTGFWTGAKAWILDNAVSKFKETFQTNVTVGALSAGSYITSGETVADVIKRMVLTVQDATINVLPKVKHTGLGAGGTTELGAKIVIKKGVQYTDGKFNSYINVTTTQVIDADCASGTPVYYKGSSVLTIADDSGVTIPMNTTGNTTFKVSVPYATSTVTPKKSDGSDSAIQITGNTASNSVTYNVYNTQYFGIGSGHTEAQLEAISNSRTYTTNTVSRIVNCDVTTGNYAWFMMPERLGTATFKVGGFEGGFESGQTISITNGSGYLEDYLVYRSTNPSLGGTEFEIIGH